MNIILGFELLLVDKLHYQLTMHNQFRPLEGFFIDIKVSIFGENYQAFSYECIPKKIFFSTKTYAVGTLKNRLNETVL